MPHVRLALPLTLLTLWAVGAPARGQPPRVTKDAPAAARPKSEGKRPSAAAVAPTGKALITSVVDADRAFAAVATQSTYADALLSALEEDGVLFVEQQVRGRIWAKWSGAPKGKFSWEPSWAAVSSAGELGVTSGPIAYAAPAPDSSWTGQYVTVWARTGSAWQAALTMAIKGSAGSTVAFAPHVPAGDGRPKGGPGAREASRATLLIADRGLAAAAMASGSPVAIPRVAASDARLLRAGALPYVGPDAMRAGLAAHDDHDGIRTVWQTRDVRMARSGDLGAAYGTYERQNPSGGVVEGGTYLRVWERQPDGGWRILVDAQRPGVP
jgi:ketosteroid isomerase-like protein